MYTIFRCLGERAAMVREKLAELVQAPFDYAQGKPISGPATASQATYLSNTETGKALDPSDEAMRKARVELGR